MKILVKCNPVGTSNNMSTNSSPVCPFLIRNSPPNLPLRSAPSPVNGLIDSGCATTVPDSIKSFKLGRRAMISRICTRSISSQAPLMANDVTYCGNLAGKGVLGGRDILFIVRAIFSTFVNHGVCLENLSGAPQRPPSEKRRSLT